MNRNKNKNIFKKKSISPLIATILLVVVAVALIAVVLTWGKTFTKESLDKTTDFADLKPSDAAFFLKVEDGLNGRFFAKFNPPTNTIKQITITGYSLLDTPRVPLDPPVTIKAYERLPLDLGIVHSPFDLVLYLDDDTIITKTGMKTTNRQPRNCPEGFIPVPGNFLYDTTNDSSMGFCVAKYEMKVDQNGDGIGDSNTDCQDSSYGVWKNNKAGCSYSDFNLVSSPEGYPLTDIKQTESIAACESIGGHLITNNEWMTLARNIEQVPSNWSSGTIGEGHIYSGHNDSKPYNALEASIDTNGYAGTGQTSGPQRRTLTLTNGEVIWDLAGNVWEWTNDNIDMSVNRPKSFNENGDEITTNGYYNYSFKTSDPSVTDYIKYDDLGNTTLKYKDLFLLTSGNYNVDNGIGRMNLSTSTNRVFLRGGSWSSGSYSGLLALNLSSDSVRLSYHIGLRCAVVP